MSDGPTWPSGDEGSTPPPPPPPSPGPAGGPPPTPAPGGTQSADIGIRLGARLIDFVILWIVNLILIVPFIVGAIFSDVSGNAALGFGSSAGGFVAGLIATAINVGYFVFLESNRGQTIGKQLLNLRTVAPHGGNPSIEEAFKRNAWLLAGLVPIIGGLAQLGLTIWIIVTISSDPENRGVHDQWAGGTQVVRTS